MGLRTLIPVGEPLRYNYFPVCGSPTQRVWDLIISWKCPSYHLLLVFGCRISLLVGLSLFLSMVVQQLVVILMFSWEEVSSSPSLPSCLCLSLLDQKKIKSHFQGEVSGEEGTISISQCPGVAFHCWDLKFNWFSSWGTILEAGSHVPIANFFHNPQQLVNAYFHVVNCIKSSESTPLQPESSHLWTFCVVCTGYSWGQLHSYCPSPTSWGLPLHLSCVGASVSWILCLPFSWFTHLSLWSTFFCSFLGKYTWVVKFLRTCISKMSLFYPHSGLKVYLGIEF